MKKIAIMLVSLLLVIVMAFTFVACDEDKNQGGGNGNGTEQGGNGGGSEALKPVDMETFVSAVLENISKADGLTVSLKAEAKGSATITAPAAEEGGDPVVTNTPIDASVSDTYALDTVYATNILKVFDRFGGLLTGTVPVAADNSGYEFNLSVETKAVRAAIDGVNGFLNGLGKTISLDEALNLILPAGTDAATWLTKVFSATITVQEFVNELDAVFQGVGIDLNTVVETVTTVIFGTPVNLDLILSMEIEVPAPGGEQETDSSTAPDGDGAATVMKKIGEVEMKTIVDPLLSSAVPDMGLTYDGIGSLLAFMGPYLDITTVYDLAMSMMYQSIGLPFPPKSAVLATAEIETAEFTLTFKTDKEMKPVSFAVQAAFKGSCSYTDAYEDTETVYAADVTASASGTFAY